MFKTMQWFFLTGLLALLQACGGGGDSCALTSNGKIDYVFTNGVADSSLPGNVLYYKLGQTNTWNLSIQGVTPACLAGMKAEITNGSGGFQLPSGITLDATTGNISSGVLTQPIEGTCTLGTTSDVRTSVNRTCPSGYTYADKRIIFLVTASKFNTGSSPVPRILNFRPQP